jgi:hypothetical protein
MRYKVTEEQIRNLENFYIQEKKIVNQEHNEAMVNRNATIYHEIEDYIILKNGFNEILESFDFKNIRETKYYNNIDELNHFAQLTVNDENEKFEFLAEKYDKIFRVLITNSLVYEKDEISSVLQVVFRAFSDTEYTNSDYKMIKPTDKVNPLKEVQKLLEGILNDFFDNQTQPAEKNKYQDMFEENLSEEIVKVHELNNLLKANDRKSIKKQLLNRPYKE